jgi:hypothetical protein
MATKPLPSTELLRKLLRYEPDTGKLFWLERPVSMFADGRQSAKHNAAIWNGKNAGKEAFTTNNGQGYRYGSILNERYLAHRVVWALHYGRDPSIFIDHKNGDRADNSIINLALVSVAENNRNMAMTGRNRSGRSGVVWVDERSKWLSQIKVDRKSIHLGYFLTFEEASMARAKAEALYGFSARHGTVPAAHPKSKY